LFFSELLYEYAGLKINVTVGFSFSSNDHLFLNSDDIYNEHGIIIGKYNFSDIEEDVKVSINLISIYPAHRRKGYFSRLMKIICQTADEHHIELELIPMPTSIKDSPAGDVGMFKLKSIYMSCGFSPEYEDMDVTIYTRNPLTDG